MEIGRSSKLKTIRLDLASAEKYLEVYRGVVSNFTGYARELSSAECVALEIVSTDPSLNSEDVVKEFRKIAGPFQWILQSSFAPSSLRAKYGISDVSDAIHCTHLPEDGENDSNFCSMFYFDYYMMYVSLVIVLNIYKGG